MNIFTEEFLKALKTKLDSLEPNTYITREQICVSIGVPPVYANAVSLVLQDPEFNGFESVRSRGIRKKK